jgi:type I restriction enzyme R subunit
MALPQYLAKLLRVSDQSDYTLLMPTPEEKARQRIDDALQKAGWSVQDIKEVNLAASRGVAVRNFPLGDHGFADYLLYIDGKAAGVVEAKKEGATLTGVEIQSTKYSEGLPPQLPAYIRPLPFLYESTGIETRFTSGLDPQSRSRNVFSFHQPATLAEWLSRQPHAAHRRDRGYDRHRHRHQTRRDRSLHARGQVADVL